MSVYLYEVPISLGYEEHDLAGQDVVSCVINAKDKQHPYASVFQDNHGFFGVADKDIHNDAIHGYVYEDDHLKGFDELWTVQKELDRLQNDQPAKKPLRIILPRDYYEKCKKLKDFSISFDAASTAAFPEPRHDMVEGRDEHPLAAMEGYYWAKNSEALNRMTAQDDYPQQFRPWSYAIWYKGEPIYESPQFHSFLGEFQDFPPAKTEEQRLFQFGLQAYQQYEPFAYKLFEPDAFLQKIAPIKEYSPEALYEKMRFRENPPKEQLYAARCRFYEDAALVLQYDAPNTPEGQEQFAKAMLVKMAKDGVSQKQMTEILLCEKNEGIMNKGLDLIEKDKAFRKELNKIRKASHIGMNR